MTHLSRFLTPKKQRTYQLVTTSEHHLVKTEKGHISNCLANFVRTLQEDPVLKGAICLNLLTERVDMLGDLGWPRSDSSAITDTDLHYLALHLEKHYGLSSEKKLRSAVDIVANENRYHPIRDKLSSLTWDGIPRIRNCLHHFLGAAEDDYTQALMQHFLLGAIRRIFHPGCKYEEILCLVGGQGIGKSTFLRFLAMEDEGIQRRYPQAGRRQDFSTPGRTQDLK